MKRSIVKTTCSLAAALALVACGAETDPADMLEPEDVPEDVEGKAEAWNSANNPSYVDPTFLLLAHQLPLEGAAPTPIPGDYWATARDNLNVKWDGATNPTTAEKYARAFGKPNVPEQISVNHGVKSATWRKACTVDSDCSDLNDGSICARSYDDAEKRCVPTWWGICHGWAPYALSERPARNPVTRTAADGSTVTFYPGDLEGLMSLLYTDVPTKFISARCNKDEPPTDAAGRVMAGECRDMNPGSWHVIVTNLMGLRKVGFVLDQTWDDQVWNQPGWKFKVTNPADGALREVTKAEAIQMLGLNQNVTALLPTTEVKKDEQKTGSHVASAAGDYTVRLTGTGDADLYVKKGAAPTLEAWDCRPYEGSSNEECAVTLAAGETVHWMVAGYSDTSSVQVGVATPSDNGTYTYNTSAKRFFHVEMDFTFIVESQPAHTSNVDNAASFAETKHYSYILETADDGRILGGEWLGSSRVDHPDFAWWPTGKPMYAQAGGLITYDEVKALNDEAAGAEPTDDVVTLLASYAFNVTTYWKSKYVAMPVDESVRSVTFTMTGTGDADLYVRKDRNPTVYAYACKSTTAGTSNETCTIDVNAGTYYVRARTRTPGTTVSITAAKTTY